MVKNNQKKKLDSFEYSIAEGFNHHITNLTYETLLKYSSGKSCLELGSADGAGTEILLKKFDSVTAVDGSSKMLTKLKRRIGKSQKLTVVHSLFENLNLNMKFDTIVMTHVLEHVDNPAKVLNTAKRHSHSETKIIIEVPNAYSLHRQAGKLMGMIDSEHSLNEADKSVGHKRVYDTEKLRGVIIKSGLKITREGGFLLKPFSNSQMLTIIGDNEKMADAYSRLGEMYPKIAAEIYIVCKTNLP